MYNVGYDVGGVRVQSRTYT